MKRTLAEPETNVRRFPSVQFALSFRSIRAFLPFNSRIPFVQFAFFFRSIRVFLPFNSSFSFFVISPRGRSELINEMD